MRKSSFLLLFFFSFFLNTGVKAQDTKFGIVDVMNKVKEFIPTYNFHHYRSPSAPDSTYGGQLLGPEDINVVVVFKNGLPVKIQLENMDIKNNPAHLSILTEVLKMVDERYLEWFMKFYKSAVKSKKYDSYDEKKDDGNILNFKHLAKTNKSNCIIFFLKNMK
ncbi:MAG: hypothetical protein ABI685_10220 [Ferruginibacter sp.]